MQIDFKISVITKYVLRYLIKYIFIKKLSFPKFGNKFSNRFDFIRGCFDQKTIYLRFITRCLSQDFKILSKQHPKYCFDNVIEHLVHASVVQSWS